MADHNDNGWPGAPRRTRPRDQGGWETPGTAYLQRRLLAFGMVIPLGFGAILMAEGQTLWALVVWIATGLGVAGILFRNWQDARRRERRAQERFERLQERKR